MTTESLALTATISAQDTTPGQAFSTAVLIMSMTSNPLSELMFGFAVFSPVKFEVSSRSNDPSQPYIRMLIILLVVDFRIYKTCFGSLYNLISETRLESFNDWTYINKTVVEEETKKGGSHSLLAWDSRLYHWLDRWEEARAWIWVEVGSELSWGGA